MKLQASPVTLASVIIKARFYLPSKKRHHTCYPAPPDAQAHAQEAHAQAQAQLAQAQTHPPLLTGACADEALASPEGVTGIKLFEKASALTSGVPAFRTCPHAFSTVFL